MWKTVPERCDFINFTVSRLHNEDKKHAGLFSHFILPIFYTEFSCEIINDIIQTMYI